MAGEAGDAEHHARFPKASRLRKRTRFLAMRALGVAVHSRHLIVVGLQTEQAHRRLGVTVTKRSYRRAVDRNQIKRWLREIFRHERTRLPEHLDLVLIAKDGALKAGYQGLLASFQEGIERLQKRGLPKEAELPRWRPPQKKAKRKAAKKKGAGGGPSGAR